MAFIPLTKEEINDYKISGFNLGNGFIHNPNFQFKEKLLEPFMQWYRFSNTNGGIDIYTVRTKTDNTWSKYSLNKEV